MSYSKDLRERALQAVRNGQTKATVSRLLGLGENTISDWEKLVEETGSLDNRPLNRMPHKIDREKLLEWYRENPHSTNKETAVEFNCSVSGVRSAKKVLGITRKKTLSNTPSVTSKNEQNLSPK